MEQIQNLNTILSAFKLGAICKNFSEYKNACFYDVELQPGTKVKDIEKYSAELSLALRKSGKPRIIVSSEEGVLRIEFIKGKKEKTSLFHLGQTAKRPKGNLTCLLGETMQGLPMWMDIATNPHLLIAGTTGSGKSTLLHNIIGNLLLYPKVNIYLMDPKNIEFFKYSDANIPRLHVAHEYEDCVQMIEKLCLEMDNRYKEMKLNKLSVSNFSYKVLIIDEYADLIMQDVGNVFYKALTKLAQKSRAAGIHIILSTQRPSVNVVDGVIKANFPARISCKVASHVDSKVILDATGAENLTGFGDALINNNDYNMQRFQVAYTSADEICRYFSKK